MLENSILKPNSSMDPDVAKYLMYLPSSSEDKNGNFQQLTDDEKIQICFEQLGKLTNFFNFKLISNPVKRKYFTKREPMNYGISKMIEHQLIFIEKTIWDLRDEKYGKSVNSIRKIIDILKKNFFRPKSDNQQIIYLDDCQLFFDVKQDPIKCLSLASLYNQLTQKLTLLSPPKLNLENAKLELKSIILDLSNKVDQKTSFVPMSMLQTSFDKLIMSDLLPWKETFQQMFKNFNETEPADFINQLFDIVDNISKYLNIDNDSVDSALSFLIYRFVFDEVYPQRFCDYQNNNIILRNERNEIMHKQIKNSELNLQLQYCPSLDLNETPSETFKNDEYYKKAVDKFDEILFQTNPLDMLAVVVQVVSYIEEAASHYDNNQTRVFPFEVTFSLFMSVVLSSSIDDISSIAQFIEDYTPSTGLCPSFDYAKSNVLASAFEIENLIEEHKQNSN